MLCCSSSTSVFVHCLSVTLFLCCLTHAWVSRLLGSWSDHHDSQYLLGKRAPEFKLDNRDVFFAPMASSPWPRQWNGHPPLSPSVRYLTGQWAWGLFQLRSHAHDESKGFGWKLRWGEVSGGWGGARRILPKWMLFSSPCLLLFFLLSITENETSAPLCPSLSVTSDRHPPHPLTPLRGEEKQKPASRFLSTNSFF